MRLFTMLSKNRNAQLVLFAVASSMPLLPALALCAMGRKGPTLAYVKPRVLYHFDKEAWYRPGCLSSRVWTTMQQPGGIVRHDDRADRFWGGLRGCHGDILVATGPRTIALARCNAPGRSGRMYGGYIRGWFVISHRRMLFYSLGCSICLFGVLLLGLSFLQWLRRRSFHSPGHCRGCGYNLYGLPESRCPECGTRFEPRLQGAAQVPRR